MKEERKKVNRECTSCFMRACSCRAYENCIILKKRNGSERESKKERLRQSNGQIRIANVQKCIFLNPWHIHKIKKDIKKESKIDSMGKEKGKNKKLTFEISREEKEGKQRINITQSSPSYL